MVAGTRSPANSGPTVAFDVIGTLFSLDRPREALRSLGVPDRALDLWFAQSLRDYFAFSHAGGYVPLREVLDASLPRSLSSFGIEVDPSGAAAVTDELSKLDLARGGAEACAALRGEGCRLVAVSNGSLDSTTELLERAGLAEEFGAVRSCDEIRVSKPAAAVYDLVRRTAEESPWLVAAHAWDIAGAQRAGLRTAWVGTVEPRYLEAYPPPDVTASDLMDAARRLLAADSIH